MNLRHYLFSNILQRIIINFTNTIDKNVCLEGGGLKVVHK